jgi:hypothetical protein
MVRLYLNIKEIKKATTLDFELINNNETFFFHAKKADRDKEILFVETKYRVAPIILKGPKDNMTAQEIENFILDWFIEKEGSEYLHETFSKNSARKTF